MSDYRERACTFCGSFLHHEDDCPEREACAEVVHGFTLPEGKDASSLDWWPEFVAYFEQREGFAPHPRDSQAKRLFEYYVEGAYQQFAKASAEPLPLTVKYVFKGEELESALERALGPIPDLSDQSVEARNARQNSPRLHPFTCGNDRGDEAHRAYQQEHGGDLGQLIAVEGGWRCPVCDYTQSLLLIR